MTKLEAFFNREMEFARRMSHRERPDYWRGYIAGLLRGFYGPSAVRDDRYATLLKQNSVTDDVQGYFEAFRTFTQVNGEDREGGSSGVETS
jgi:hypothetical protein